MKLCGFQIKNVAQKVVFLWQQKDHGEFKSKGDATGEIVADHKDGPSQHKT